MNRKLTQNEFPADANENGWNDPELLLASNPPSDLRWQVDSINISDSTAWLKLKSVNSI